MEDYSNIEQVAAHYKVSKSTVRSWIRAKLIPFLKVGGMYRFKMSEVDTAFLLRTEQRVVVPGVPVVPVVPVVEQATAAAFNPDQDA